MRGDGDEDDRYGCDKDKRQGDGEDEGEDGYDEDVDMSMPPLIPVSASAPAGHPPPSKRPKVTHLHLAPASPHPPCRSSPEP